MSLANACNAHAISLPHIPGAQIQSLLAEPVTSYSTTYPSPSILWTKTKYQLADFCNVTVRYTRPGSYENTTITIYLPDSSEWNRRLAAAGGGGWSAQMGDGATIPPLDAGFAVVQTDAGVTTNMFTSSAWALHAPETPNLSALNYFASDALHHMAVAGKQIVESFYGRPPSYSYWTGCSQGGRQGNMMAQRYPNDFDGIAALAPAINFAQVFISMSWGRQVMHETGIVPPLCEVRAFTSAVVAKCDELDGVVDGIVSRPDLCDFDLDSVVGQTFDCDGEERKLSAGTAKVIQAAWSGPRKANGDFFWYGYGVATKLDIQLGTTCSEDGGCSVNDFTLPDDWMRYWIAGDPNLDLTNLTHAEFARMAHLGVQKYDSIIGTAGPDIKAFRDAGGKMITWHGTTDALIPDQGSTHYYNRVREVDETVDDYFRLFLAPGTGHCFPGSGYFPHGVLEDLINWVEEGVTPEQLVSQNHTQWDPSTGDLPGSVESNIGRGRPLCVFPKMQQYIGGDPDMMASYRCEAPEKKQGSMNVFNTFQSYFSGEN